MELTAFNTKNAWNWFRSVTDLVIPCAYFLGGNGYLIMEIKIHCNVAYGTSMWNYIISISMHISTKEYHALDKSNLVCVCQPVRNGNHFAVTRV